LSKLNNSFRIIAGQWRGRRIKLIPNAQLRPTPGRVRETVFNWLAHDLKGAIGLDLFAGSGALGIEALSRGAKNVVFVEQHLLSAEQIKQSLQMLKAESSSYTVLAQTVEAFLRQAINKKQAFDLIFLDPPFHNDWWKKLQSDLFKITHPESLIYLEVEKEAEALALPENWTIFREKTAGQLRYYLLTQKNLD